MQSTPGSRGCACAKKGRRVRIAAGVRRLLAAAVPRATVRVAADERRARMNGGRSSVQAAAVRVAVAVTELGARAHGGGPLD
eukprot:1739491-Prymnesium_polylepis.1